jgi:hypothetical protein
MHVFANSAAERTSAGPKAAAEAGLLGVVQLSRVVERCHNVPLRRGMDRQLVATTQPRGPIQRDPASSRLRGGRRETEKEIVREDGYTYIAALRSPDLRHTTKREGDTSVTVVTSKFSCLQLYHYSPEAPPPVDSDSDSDSDIYAAAGPG